MTGIGIRADAGRVYLDFFAAEITIELTAQEAMHFAESLQQVAKESTIAAAGEGVLCIPTS